MKLLAEIRHLQRGAKRIATETYVVPVKFNISIRVRSTALVAVSAKLIDRNKHAKSFIPRNQNCVDYRCLNFSIKAIDKNY